MYETVSDKLAISAETYEIKSSYNFSRSMTEVFPEALSKF